MTSSRRSLLSRRALRRATGAGLVVGAFALAAVSVSSPAPAAPARPAARNGTLAKLTSTSAQPQQPSSCPTSTYPTSPGSHTGYGIAFKAVVLDGQLNAGYHELANGAGDIYAPWGIHAGNLTGTVCGLIELPSLNLSATPSDIQIGTYGLVSGPASLSAAGQSGATAQYTFTGIADPGADAVAFNVYGVTLAGGYPGSTDAVAYYRTGKSPALSIPASSILLDTGKNKTQAAGSYPGATINGNLQPYSGTFTLVNNSGQEITDIQGEEPAGFIDGPLPGTCAPGPCPGGNALGAGQHGSFSWSVVSSYPTSANLAISVRAETPSGPVNGFAIAYYTTKETYVPTSISVSNIEINGSPASAAPGPSIAPGSVYTATFDVTNNSSYPVTNVNDQCFNNPAQSCAYSTSSQAPSIFALLGLPVGPTAGAYGYSVFSLQAFSLDVNVPCVPGTSGPDCPANLVTIPDGVCGVAPNNCVPPGALSAEGITAADSSFTAIPGPGAPPITCFQDVAVRVTTGSSRVVPEEVLRYAPQDAHLPVWTVQGQGIVGPLIGAQGVVVANDFGLTVRDQPPAACFPQDAEFDEIAGGTPPAGSSICAAQQNPPYCYYNGNNPALLAQGCMSASTPCLPNDCMALNAAQFCGPPGELQLSAEVVVTSVDVPSFHETGGATRG